MGVVPSADEGPVAGSAGTEPVTSDAESEDSDTSDTDEDE